MAAINTQYLYLSNIPSNVKPVLLLHKLKNKWARMLYLENSFSGVRDAIVYNPVKNPADAIRGVENLRTRDTEEVSELKVHYVFFPPPDVFLTTMIPEGAAMLPYVLMENLPKDSLPPEIISNLPLQVTDLKPWNVSERNDKCMLIKLPLNCSFPMRSFILGTLRTRAVRGFLPKVFELIISEDPVLTNTMVPRMLKIDREMKPFQSNFFYIHDIPSKVTVKMLVESAKTEEIKGARVFFLETFNNMKFGFMYIPKSLPKNRFMSLYNNLREKKFILNENDNENEISEESNNTVKINEVWFQPEGCEEPKLEDLDDRDDDDEFILTDYVFISGVPANIAPQQLMFGCPTSLVKLSLFNVNEMDTQLGFLLMRGLEESMCNLIIRHLRGLKFNGFGLEVNEVYLRCKGVSKMLNTPFQLIPRQKTFTDTTPVDVDVLKNGFDNWGKRPNSDKLNAPLVTPETLKLVEVPSDEYSLMKTEFLCVDNLPRNVGSAALLVSAGKASGGCVILPSAGGGNKAFMYFPDCTSDEWLLVICNLLKKSFGGKQVKIHEVYLQTDNPTSDKTEESFVETNFVFVYNIDECATLSDIYQLNPNSVSHAEILETNEGSKSAFIVVNYNLNASEINAFVKQIRKGYINGKPLYADPVRLAHVDLTSKKIKLDC